MLKVTAWMSSPIAGDVPHLDALLEFEMAQRAGVACQLRADHPAPPAGEIHIPMLRKTIGGHCIACCSSPIFRATRVCQEHITKRLGVEHADSLAPQQRVVVPMGNSTYKSYRLPLIVRDVDRIVYLCEGHRKPLLKLLKSVKSLGKKRSVGYGRVARWEAENIAGDHWWFADDVLMRPLPLCVELPNGLRGCKQDFGACSPPYWHPDRYIDRVVPV